MRPAMGSGTSTSNSRACNCGSCILHPVGALAAHKWPHATTLIAPGRLHLNHLGPQTRQDEPNARPSLVSPQVQDPDTLQSCLRHGHGCLLSVLRSPYAATYETDG